MKKLFHVVLGLATLCASSAFAADVGVSISVGEPGFYGRIDIGNFPPPVLVYPQPVLIEAVPVAVARQPIYLHVPPGHAKDWAKHCHKYGACSQRVYFVRDSWYSNVYVPEYQRRHGPPERAKGQGKGQGKGHKKDKD